jgi:hypothetical protein
VGCLSFIMELVMKWLTQVYKRTGENWHWLEYEGEVLAIDGGQYIGSFVSAGADIPLKDDFDKDLYLLHATNL